MADKPDRTVGRQQSVAWDMLRSVTADARGTVAEAGTDRLGHVDDLKVALTAGVILAHCAITYGGDGSWFYREPGGGVLVALLDLPLALGALFGMGLFFFLAGAFTPPALARKGRAAFLAGRWLRLGVPLAAFVVLVIPALHWLVDGATGAGGSPAPAWRRQAGDLDTGPLWFVGVLLLFSTGYALVVPRDRVLGPPRTVGAATLVGFAVAVAVTSYLVRIRFRIDSYQLFAAHLWQWPQCLALFVLGLLAGRSGWLTAISPGQRRAGTWVLGAGAAGVLAVLVAGRHDLDPFGGGLTWQSVVVCALEGPLSVSAAVVLTDLFRRRRRGTLSRHLGAWAYGAYVLQAPVLVAIALALRPTGLPPSVKFLVLLGCGLVACFTLAGALRRLPGARRVL